MVAVHPNILERNGKKEFVVLPYEEFVRMEEELQEYEDLRLLRAAKAKESHAPTVSLREARKALGLRARAVVAGRRR